MGVAGDGDYVTEEVRGVPAEAGAVGGGVTPKVEDVVEGGGGPEKGAKG